MARFQQVPYIDEGRLRSATLAGLRSAPAAKLQKRSYTYRLSDKHRAEWTEVTTNAFVTARDNICEGREPRQDDVLKMLMPMLEPNETLRKHQEQHHARFKHYREAFAEYMIDIYFKDLKTKKEKRNE